MAELYDTDIPGFRNFMRTTPDFFEMLKERLAPRLIKQTTNWNEPQSVGLTIATTLRGDLHLTPLPVQKWEASISKFVVPVCRAIVDEFMAEHFICPTTTEAWKELEAELRLRWNVPHAIGALDGKHLRIKKPPKSGSLYHNYKGFFSVILMALVDAEYRFRWTLGQKGPAQMPRYSTLVS